MTVGDQWLILDEVDSTQSEAGRRLAAGEQVDVVFAHHQTQGRGRFDRAWLSQRGDSLTFSLVLRDYIGHPKPWLLGMSAGIAAASAARARIRWPNDVVVQGKKVGGILTQLLLDDKNRKVPVVGIGVNLNQEEFPSEVADIATSLYLVHGNKAEPVEFGRAVVERLRELPDPASWEAIAPMWSLFDDTPGKPFRTVTGQEVTAIGIGGDGELIASWEGETIRVMAAEALALV